MIADEKKYLEIIKDDVVNIVATHDNLIIFETIKPNKAGKIVEITIMTDDSLYSSMTVGLLINSRDIKYLSYKLLE